MTYPYPAPAPNHGQPSPPKNSGAYRSSQEIARVYEILGELGRGGMGAVYKAKHRQTGTLHAIKTIIPNAAADPDSISRFQREALITCKLNHPAIVNVQSLEKTTDGKFFLIQDMVNGSTLKDIIKEKVKYGLDENDRDELFDILIRVAEALDYAHKQGVLHRDIKPENIMYDETKDQVYIMDFGLAKAVQTATGEKPLLSQDGQSLTMQGDILGTPAFMSPEQFNDSKSADYRADIFALGAILSQIVYGRLHVNSKDYIGIYNELLTKKDKLTDKIKSFF